MTEDILKALELVAIACGVLWLIHERKQKNQVLAQLPKAVRAKERKLEIKKFLLVLGMIFSIVFLMLFMTNVVEKQKFPLWVLDVSLIIILGAAFFVVYKLSNEKK